MKYLPLALFVAVSAAALGGPAHAEFIISDDHPMPRDVERKSVQDRVPVPPRPSSAPSRASMPGQGQLVQVGAPLPGPSVQGWAEAVPLALALQQVIPTGWKLETGSVDTERTVSWRGGRSWPAIVGELGHHHRFDTRIDWIAQRVTLGAVGSLAPSALATIEPARKETGVESPADLAPSRPAAAVIARPPAPVAVAPVVPVGLKPIAPPVAMWALDPAKTLKENITAWAQKAGWNRVVWEGADYPVVAPATFTGDFAGEDGPVATVIAAYDKSEQPLLATLSLRDKVVLVINRNYVPTAVIPTSPATLSPEAFPAAGISEKR